MSAALVAFAAPALADDQPAAPAERLGALEHMTITAIKEQQPSTERLDQLEHVTITAIKAEQPEANAADERLDRLEYMSITAPKQQPADHKVDAETKALLDEIAAID